MYSFDNATQERWEQALSLFAEANLLQSWQWGETNRTLGHTVVRRTVVKDGSIVGAMSCTIKNARRGRYLEVAGGPLIDWSDTSLVDETIAELRTIGARHNCVFLRFRTQLEDTPAHHSSMQRIHAKPSLMHVTADHTSIIDLSPNTDTLLTQMRQQTRYEVRRATKLDVVVEQIDPLSHIEEFHELQIQTASRQNFFPPTQEFLDAVCASFGKHVHLYKASKDGVLLNLAIVIFYGTEATYFEAASTEKARREAGAYAIVWQAMQDAKAEGIAALNLWGTAPPHIENHRYSGVTTFKRGFGGRDVAYLSAHDIALRPLRYQLTRMFEFVRKKRRHL